MSSKDTLVRASRFFGEATKRLVLAGATGALAFTLAACGGQAAEPMQDVTQGQEEAAEVQETETQEDEAETQDTQKAEVDILEFSIDPSGLFSKRDLDASYKASEAVKVTLADDGTTVSGKGVTVDGSTVTINAEGTYILSGTITDGRIVVDVDDAEKVQLVLDGVDVTSSTGTALYVRNADKVFLTLAEGSTNVITSTGERTSEDDHTLDGTIFSCDDLTVNGTGSLEVQSETCHGIVGKDELTLVEGNLTVAAAGSAIQAKDSVAVKDGSYTLASGTDGIHVENDSNGAKGFAYIAGGTFDITCGTDGIDASNDILIDGGTLNIAAGDDGIHSEYDLVINDGTIRITESYEGLEGSTVTLNGGDVVAVSSDDGVNATGVPSESNAEAETADTPFGEGGEPEFGDKPEMLEGGMGGPGGGPQGDGSQGDGQDMGAGPGGGMRGGGPADMEDFDFSQLPDEGAGDGAGNRRMGGDMGGGPGGGFDNDDTAEVIINGGKLVVVAGGDGIDSNGALTVTGGEIYVSGPTSDGDGSLDYGGEATITGGIVMAAGSSGMAETFGDGSTQGSMLVTASGSAGDTIELLDADGNVMASFEAQRDYACVVASAPGMVEGGTYTLNFGSNTTEVTLDSIAYRNVQGGMGGGMGGPGGGQMRF